MRQEDKIFIEKWENDKSKNPETGRKIKENGKTFIECNKHYLLLKKKYKQKILVDTQSDNNEITKEDIIELFNKNIKGKKYVKNKDDHCGSEGHWLEKMMNLNHNSKNAPDIGGYEMKKNSKKITLGDWSGEYLFSSKKNILDKKNGKNIKLTREQFIKFFGNKNNKKNGRYSWSGSCVPKYDKWNIYGQKLMIDNDDNIIALYSWDKDTRINRDHNILGKYYLHFKDAEYIHIALWSKVKMENHVEKKFNQNGFFICEKNKDNIYNKILFGTKFNFKLFLDNIKNNKIYLDSGMYHDDNKPNTRLYSQWRANNNFWHDLIIEEY